MKAIVVALGLGLALAGCTIQSEEDQLEDSIRNNLSSQGNVLNVELTRSDENNMTGFVDIRENDGREGRLACTAQRTEGSHFQWRCSPAITEQVVQELEGQIRTNLSQQGQVMQVDLTRQDDNRMTGYSIVRNPAGNEVRMNCTATRDTANIGSFNWECVPGDQAQAAAPADQGGK
jgi:hypothetical protein